MEHLTVIHLQPIEFYPPAVNLIRHAKSKGINVEVHTTSNRKGIENFECENVSVIRHDHNWLPRVLRFALANIMTAIFLLRARPQLLIYYDTFSAFPAAVLKLILGRRTRILNHCHEYHSPEWYRNSTSTLRFFNFIERQFLYSRVAFVSQTNPSRVEMFLQDNPQIDPNKMKVFPNYPPPSWNLNARTQFRDAEPFRFVYVGVVSFEYTYIREFCDWLIRSDRNDTLDIYTRNCGQKELDYLDNIGSPNIRCHPNGIDYDKFPGVLPRFDVGLLLYRAITKNFKYNESNKLFEYLSADLDVLYPTEMLGVSPHATSKTYPIIQPLNFSTLDDYDWTQLFDKTNLIFSSRRHFSDTVFDLLIETIDH
jgi:hypothetical protein